MDGLVALYVFEPGLRDVITEGRTDASLINWYLDGRSIPHTAVRAVDDLVEVPSDAVVELGATVGARGRAIALAHYFDQALELGQRSVTVVADADWSEMQQPGKRGPSSLLFTDQAAMDNYSFQESPVQKLLDVYFHYNGAIEAQTVIAALTPSLVLAHGVRRALFDLEIACINKPHSLLESSRTSTGWEVTLSAVELVRRSCSAFSTSPAEQAGTVVAAKQYASELAQNGRGGRGHDIAPFLATLLNLKGPLAAPETLEAAMRACLEVTDLQSWPLFVSLEERLRA